MNIDFYVTFATGVLFDTCPFNTGFASLRKKRERDNFLNNINTLYMFTRKK